MSIACCLCSYTQRNTSSCCVYCTLLCFIHRTLRVHLRVCNKAHKCSEVPVKPVLVVREYQGDHEHDDMNDLQLIIAEQYTRHRK